MHYNHENWNEKNQLKAGEDWILARTLLGRVAAYKSVLILGNCYHRISQQISTHLNFPIGSDLSLTNKKSKKTYTFSCKSH